MFKKEINNKNKNHRTKVLLKSINALDESNLSLKLVLDETSLMKNKGSVKSEENNHFFIVVKLDS